MGGVDTGTRIAFTADGETLRVRDLIEGKEMVVEADREIDPVPALTDLFVFPVDRAVSFETESIHLPSHSMVRVRDGGGEFLGNLLETAEYPTEDYLFDVTGNVRTYIRVEDIAFSASGRNEDDSLTVEFEDLITVTVGSRSLHTQPEATLVVPDDPAAAMEAISHLGSSIKEFSAERSWPTLRGHPPRFRRGDTLEIPDSIHRPDTGIRIEIPPTFSDVYRIAPLAFYLGATVEPGDDAALHLENGYTEPLRSSGRTLSETVEELLKRCFLLDSIVRTEGYIPSCRYEYEELGPDLSFYPPNLYDATLSTQLIEYLEVERSVLEPYYPTWSTTAVLRPDPSDVELLPYLAHTLSPIRVSEHFADGSDEEGNGRTVPYGWPGGQVPNFTDGETVPSLTPEMLPSTAAILNVQTYENAFELPPATPGDGAVALVTDSPDRSQRWREQLSSLTEGTVGLGKIDILLRPERDSLRTLFSGRYDGVYVALPLEEDEIVCANGGVSLDRIRDVDARFVAFEAGSMENAQSVVRNGAVAATVVDGPVSGDRLREFLELLGIGLSIGKSTELAFSEEPIQVRFVGDPGHQMSVNKDGTPPHVVELDPVEIDHHRVTTHSFLSVRHRAGEELKFHAEYLGERSQLLGVRCSDYRSKSAEEVLELAAFGDSILETLGKTVVDPERFTEKDIRRAVRRSRWKESDREIPET
ncbi:Uncharacterized protein AArcCO_0759 [Halalkaliarchaeum sp. AArc-CO]|uniref:hypothetical protein n=1 Tax=Halalkaliarchaeum sp. AArc-CO TaxID=2866381 RepID=UPI00217E91BF|nr:hypothetical protein [Halalkaliarchaeum sp. AArc-CO]UWG50079.1 Uncharacterized protein AArcCO_0759 [Halalkaliarchaeum sp. AArc-CO]